MANGLFQVQRPGWGDFFWRIDAKRSYKVTGAPLDQVGGNAQAMADTSVGIDPKNKSEVFHVRFRDAALVCEPGSGGACTLKLMAGDAALSEGADWKVLKIGDRYQIRHATWPVDRAWLVATSEKRVYEIRQGRWFDVSGFIELSPLPSP